MAIFYEEFKVGDVFVSPGRTITEGDITQFAAYTADNNPLHTNEEFAKQTVFGGRIAHGMLGASMAIGLWCRLGLMDGSALAFLGTSWEFVGAIKVGDTITSHITMANKRMTKKPGVGIIFLEFDVKNQKGETVQTGTMKLMTACKDPNYTE